MKERQTITLGSMRDMGHFALGMRIATGTQRNTLLRRIWRWLTRRNLRVVEMDYDVGCIVVERSR